MHHGVSEPGVLPPVLFTSSATNSQCLTSYHEIANVPYEFAKTGTTIAAIGCGLLGATAVAVSPTLEYLATTATPQVVRVAFRLGIHVYEVSSLLEAPVVKGDAESWAYVVPGVQADTVQAEIDAYNKMTVSTPRTYPYASPQVILISRLIVESQTHDHLHQRIRQCLGERQWSTIAPCCLFQGICRSPLLKLLSPSRAPRPLPCLPHLHLSRR